MFVFIWAHVFVDLIAKRIYIRSLVSTLRRSYEPRSEALGT